MNHTAVVFTDGASRGNPGPGGWGSIVVFKEGDNAYVQELGGREDTTTNNRMELTAVIEALAFLKSRAVSNSISLYTDSSYVLKGATTWVHGWQRNNWQTSQKKDVLNVDLWKVLLQILSGMDIFWKLVPGHSDIPGNERCDHIATTYADGGVPELYAGPLSKYGIDVTVTKSLGPVVKKSSTKSGKAYSYVSAIKGVVKVHKTWAECEDRVRGVAGARYKKVFSKEEERALTSLWKK